MLGHALTRCWDNESIRKCLKMLKSCTRVGTIFSCDMGQKKAVLQLLFLSQYMSQEAMKKWHDLGQTVV